MAGLATIAFLENEKIFDKVRADEKYLKSSLAALQLKYPLIGDVRGKGLLWGVELVLDKKTKEKAINEAEVVMYECLKRGLSYKVSAGNVLQLSPALTISRKKLNKALNILDESLAIVHS